MTEKTINDVYEAVLEQKGDIKVIIAKYESFEAWREQHDKDDKFEHAELHKRISNSRSTSVAFSIIMALFGFFTGTKVK